MRTLRTSAWLPAAAVLFGTGWGANQFSPMLLVYRRTLGLGTGALEALFGVYALGLIPVLLRGVPGTVAASGRRPTLVPAGLGSHRFRRVVAPMAPWAFAAPAVAFALLPSVVGAARHTDGIALTAGITALCALSGVLVQPFARRLDAAGRPVSTAGLAVTAGG